MHGTRLQRPTDRRGALTVEMALTLPVLFAVVMGGIEFGYVTMAVNTVENAAYEGARQGIVPNATADEVKAATRKILRAIGVQNPSIQVTPSTITKNTTEVTVQVDVPLDSNGFMPPVFMKGTNIRRKVTLTRERLE